jgi:two-component system, chemotaxis family, chemotaxis protein CheY
MDATGPTALVIDDSPLIRRYLRFRLVSRGWNVVEAQDAYSGLMTMNDLHPELVTLDLVMPINNGIDAIHLARKIRQDSPDTVILIVSALVSEHDVREFMARNNFEWFAKDPAEAGGFGRLFTRIDDLFVELSKLEQLAGDAPIKH